MKKITAIIGIAASLLLAACNPEEPQPVNPDQPDNEKKEKQEDVKYLTVETTEFNISGEAQTITVKVSTNQEIEYTVDGNCSEWVSFNTQRSGETLQYDFDLLKNDNYDERTGHIFFKQKDGDLSGRVTIYQKPTKGIRDALVALYEATDGDHWYHNDNWLSDKPYEEWYGIDFSDLSNFSLANNNLSGTVPPDIVQFKSIRNITLGGNNLSGDINELLGYFAEIPTLEMVTLSENQFTGEIGDVLTKMPEKMFYLNVASNKLSGSLPEITGMDKLESLILSDNYLTGSIPEHYADYPNLSFLDIHTNCLSGIIPEKVTQHPWFTRWMYNPQREGYSLEAEVYESVDYSRDGNVTLLQAATVGNGIDIVVMGAGFVDLDIASGEYAKQMSRVEKAFFAYEPFKSHREYFNIYSVDVVSKSNDLNDPESTPFHVVFGDVRLGFNADDAATLEYALKAVGEERLENAIKLTLLNRIGDSGFATLEISACFCQKNLSDEAFAHYVQHEAVGHCFGKFADEYVHWNYMYSFELKDGQLDEEHAKGWSLNIDTESDPEKVLWAKFIADKRYEDEKIGLYEGVFGYDKGVYRATQNGVMNEDIAPYHFNAPQREVIYKKIHTLGDGPDWEYDYETFVEYDLKHR